MFSPGAPGSFSSRITAPVEWFARASGWQRDSLWSLLKCMADTSSHDDTVVEEPAAVKPFLPVRFNTRTLLGATAILAFVLFVVLELPPYLSLPLLAGLRVIVFACCIAGALYATGSGKTFCIGACAVWAVGTLHFGTQWVWMVIQAVGFGTDMTDPESYAGVLAVAFAAETVSAIFGGIVVVVARNYWERVGAANDD